MKVPGKPRRIEIDFVRGIAILLVMFAHFKKPFTGIGLLDGFNWVEARGGGSGVDLFFVLSGFLVGGLLLKEYRDTHSVQPIRFLVRRAFKIWPAYYFLILFHVVTRRHPLNSFLWQNFFHLQNYFGSSIKQSWTLSVEEHFYTLLALILGGVAVRAWSPSRILKLLVGISCLAMLARCITSFLGNTVGALTWTQNRIDSLLFGVMIALLFYFMPETYAKISSKFWLLAGVSAFGVLFTLLVPDPEFFYGPGLTVLYISCGAFLILVMEYSGKLTELWIYRIIAQIGVYSYGLYLWHSTALEVGERILARYPSGWNAWLLALSAQFIFAAVVAYAATRLVEWPMLYYRESIPWLRDSKPLAAASEDPGPSNPIQSHQKDLAPPV